MEKPNIILVTIDSLRLDRIYEITSGINKCPTLTNMIENGIICNNSFSTGCPTQISFPSIFSNSLPLDFNGYDQGIKYRPDVLAETLNNNGYYTVGFNTGTALSSFFHYNRGFNIFNEYTTLSSLWYTIRKLYLDYYTKLWNGCLIKKPEYYGKIKMVLKWFFHHIKYLNSKNNVKNIFSNDFISKNTHREIIIQLEDELLKDTGRFIKKYSKHFNITTGRYIKQVCESELINFFNGSRYSAKSLSIGLMVNSVFNKYDLEIKINLDKNSYKTDHLMFDNVNSWLSVNNIEPYFLWTHCMSVHDKVYSNKFALIPSRDKIYDHQDKDSCKFYDYSINIIDKQLGKIVETLKQKKSFSNSVFIITSDHGHNAGAPYRKDAGLGNTPFYEEFLKVPIIIFGAGIEQRKISKLISSVDLFPTIVELARLKNVNEEYMGESVFSDTNNKRNYILAEHLGRGPCDFTNKSVNICVRDELYKLIWREDKRIQNEFYDLIEDPFEKNNLFNKSAGSKAMIRLNNIAINRCNEIRNTSNT